MHKPCILALFCSYCYYGVSFNHTLRSSMNVHVYSKVTMHKWLLLSLIGQLVGVLSAILHKHKLLGHMKDGQLYVELLYSNSKGAFYDHYVNFWVREDRTSRTTAELKFWACSSSSQTINYPRIRRIYKCTFLDRC